MWAELVWRACGCTRVRVHTSLGHVGARARAHSGVWGQLNE